MKALLIILGCIICTSISAQKEHVVARFDIYLDNKRVESDSVFVGLTRTNAVPKLLRINNDFNTYLEINESYIAVITHPGYNKQTVYIDTSVKKGIVNVKINLKRNAPDCTLGHIRYNKLLKSYTFID